MFLVNLVPMILIVGVLTESRVDAAEHLRQQPCNLREAIGSLFDKLIEYSLNADTDNLVNLFHQDAKVMTEGLPLAVGHDEIRTLLELIPEKASDINISYEVQPMDEGADYVCGMVYFEFFNDSGEKYMAGNGLDVFRKSGDEYKFYIVMFNKQNQQTLQ